MFAEVMFAMTKVMFAMTEVMFSMFAINNKRVSEDCICQNQ